MDYSKPYLGKIVTATIDRPIGSKHPKHDYTYELNYGFIPNTFAPDGEGIDVYILGVDSQIKTFKGKCIAIIHRTNDDDDKLVLCDPNSSYNEKDIRRLTDFQEKWFKSVIITTL